MPKGIVGKINEKSGMGKNGPWTRYSFVLEDGSGADGEWYTYGFKKPPFPEGAVIEFDSKETQYGKEALPDTVEVLKNERSPQVNASVGSAPIKDTRQMSICRQSATQRAIEFVNMGLTQEVFPASILGTKAGDKADNLYNLVTAYADKFYDRFINSPEPESEAAEGDEEDGSDWTPV